MRRVTLHGFKSFTFENTLISTLHVVHQELLRHPVLDSNGFATNKLCAIASAFAFRFINFSVLSFIIALIHFEALLTKWINNQIETGDFMAERNEYKQKDVI